MNLLKEIAGVPVRTDLKRSDASDAGSNDVVDKGQSDISFSMTRNTINSDGEITGSDVSNYLEKAAEINDDVDTVPFGLETDDGDIVKVYVNADQADKFEEAMKKFLGLEDDIEEAINALAQDFDIVDVVWPKSKEEDEEPVELSGDDFDPLQDSDDEEMEVVAEYDSLDDLKEGQIDKATLSKAGPVGRKLFDVVANLSAMSPAGVEAETGFDRKNHTKSEMIAKHVAAKYPAECKKLRKSLVDMAKDFGRDADLPYWLA